MRSFIAQAVGLFLVAIGTGLAWGVGIGLVVAGAGVLAAGVVDEINGRGEG